MKDGFLGFAVIAIVFFAAGFESLIFNGNLEGVV